MARLKKKVTFRPIRTELEYGTVYIAEGRHKGRIAYYDDDDLRRSFVYFGSYFVAAKRDLVNHSYLAYPTVNNLLTRKEEIARGLFDNIMGLNMSPRLEYDEMYDLLAELNLIEAELMDRMFSGRFKRVEEGKNVFLAHSSKDKPTVRQVHDDLKKLGHNPWIDEVNIVVGDSIPLKLQEGLQRAEFVIVFFSPSAVLSKWVELEWVAKFWNEINEKKKYVLPALVEDCELTPLLKHKKYADFRTDYNDGLWEIIQALGK